MSRTACGAAGFATRAGQRLLQGAPAAAREPERTPRPYDRWEGARARRLRAS